MSSKPYLNILIIFIALGLGIFLYPKMPDQMTLGNLVYFILIPVILAAIYSTIYSYLEYKKCKTP